MGSIRIDGMTTTLGELSLDLDACHQLIRELLESLAEQTHLSEKLQPQLELLLRQRYGRKTEKIDPAQLLLFAREILAASDTTAHGARHEWHEVVPNRNRQSRIDKSRPPWDKDW
jgi:Transposase C of IS166 homeodomain